MVSVPCTEYRVDQAREGEGQILALISGVCECVSVCVCVCACACECMQGKQARAETVETPQLLDHSVTRQAMVLSLLSG